MNTYLLVWGIKVSGYTQFASVETLQGDTLDGAYNAKYLTSDIDMTGTVVLEVHKMIVVTTKHDTGIGVMEETTTRLERII